MKDQPPVPPALPIGGRGLELVPGWFFWAACAVAHEMDWEPFQWTRQTRLKALPSRNIWM